MRALRNSLLGLLVLAGVVPLAQAQDLLPSDNGIYDYHQSPRWRETESHPLRIVGYALHPIGWALREGIFRPFSHYVGSTEFNRSLWGFREPFDFRGGLCDKGGDGVPDCRQMAPWSSLSSGPGSANDGGGGPGSEGGLSSRQVCIPDVAFDFDKASLNDLGRGRLRQVAQLLTTEPSIEVVVEGNADFKGTDEYNDKLGLRRADTVVKELVELGVDAKRLSPLSRGESAPVFTEEEDWARAVNRRVRFEVKPAAAQSATSSTNAGEPSAAASPEVIRSQG